MPEGLAIPDLLLVAAAMFLLLLAAALELAGRMLSLSLGKAPVIGPWVADHLVAWLYDARDKVMHAARASWDGAARLFLWAERWIVHLWDTITSFAAATAQTIDRIVTVKLPALRAEAEAWALDATARAISAASAEIDLVRTWADGRIAQVQQDMTTLFTQAEQDAVAARNQAEAYAGALVGSVYTDLDTIGRQAMQEVWPGAAGDVAALRKALGGNFPWLDALLPALAGGGAIGLGAALVQSLAGAQAVTKLATECIVPNCENLSGLGSLLSELEALITGGALLALLEFMVRDPAAAARDAETVLFPLVNDTAAAFADVLLGVAGLGTPFKFAG